MAKSYKSGNVEIQVKPNTGSGWVAVYLVDGKRDEDKTYYAGDCQDAQDTAQFMIDRLNIRTGSEQINFLLTEIANKHLDVETLETQKMDDSDFYKVPVWEIKAALQAAYAAGCRSVK